MQYKRAEASVTQMILFLSVICLAGLSNGCATPRVQGSNPPLRANADATRTLGMFKPVLATNYLMAPISSSREAEYSKGSFDNVHNYVFFNKENETAHTLLATNDYWIADTKSFPEKDEAGGGLPTVTQWFLYSLVKVDSDGDRKLTYKDHRTLALSDAGGNGYTEIVPDVEEVYGQTLREPATLLIFYRSQSKRYVAKLDLVNRKVISISELDLQLDDLQ
jgi:hypothetical protein